MRIWGCMKQSIHLIIIAANLGWMKQSINPSINGVTGRECNAVAANSTDIICFSDDAKFVDPDPGHSFEDVVQQVFGFASMPSMSGFAEQASTMADNFSQTVMRGFSHKNVTIYAELVKEFVVFDAGSRQSLDIHVIFISS